MFNVDDLTTNKHHLIKGVEEIFGHKYNNPDDYITGRSHPFILDDGFDLYFCHNLFKKVENVDLGLDPSRSTLNDFVERCREQMDEDAILQLRLESALADPRASNFNMVMCEFRKFMHNCFKDFKGARIEPRFTFGATIECNRGASVFSRMKHMGRYNDAVIDMFTSGLHEHLCAHDLTLYPMFDINHEYNPNPSHVSIRTVWKTAKASRVIGLHESGLMPIQNGFGDYLTKNILPRYCGIDISSAQNLHRELARENSITGEFGTSDQRNASNNILRSLVEFGFPSDVVQFMNCITPTRLEIDGTIIETKMMCPQGNGFIFPLQTLVFYGLIFAIQRVMRLKHKIYVYGDDVILHQNVFKPFNNLLGNLFMQPNMDKSYCDEFIRESCGADYVYGLNVRSLYVTKLPETTKDWIVLANGIRRVGYYNNGHNWRNMRYLRLWAWCIHSIPETERIYCPRSLGDAGINVESLKRYNVRYHDRSQNIPLLRGHAWERYERGGYNIHGYPYSAESIKVYTSFECSSESSTTVIDEIAGLSRHKVLRVLTNPSLVDTGFKLFRLDKSVIDETGVVKNISELMHLRRTDPAKVKHLQHVKTGYYPVVFNTHDTGTRVQWIPYTDHGRAPDDIEELFQFIAKNNPQNIIVDTEYALERHEMRRLSYIRDLKDVLIRIVHKRDVLAKKATIVDDIF